ncbi:hypothetical protein NUW54_g4889 [Trametes sanguinea]|uniref:Uncharacterized protein n=1 Tax=Trametes sanguinea TaxID=158606 RepID=A0ACC1PWM0_9APHY|nr:hypothetical protein NUW54_g4889 [Trametes sanguinea]
MHPPSLFTAQLPPLRFQLHDPQHGSPNPDRPSSRPLEPPICWCAITAFGTFDPQCSGHLVLWELRMVIEFPPGSTILISSAILTHSNTDLAPNERRYSLTQYTAGGLFRWVACGFQSARSAGKSTQDLSEGGQERWREGIQLMSHWSELSHL